MDEKPTTRLSDGTKVVLVVAMGENHVIGSRGGLPWHIPSDLAHFRRVTIDKPVIMGRRTFQSIGHALERRPTIVVSRDPRFEAPDVLRVPDCIEALRAAAILAESDEICIVGGAQVYRCFMPRADLVHMTLVHATPEGDAVFPSMDPSEWRSTPTTIREIARGDDHPTSRSVMERIGPRHAVAPR